MATQDSLTEQQIVSIVYEGGEPPRVAGGHIWKRDPCGGLDTESNFLPDPHSTAITCVACGQAFCVFCPDDGIAEPCDQVIQGELAPPALEA